jgi:hypothetical protein
LGTYQVTYWVGAHATLVPMLLSVQDKLLQQLRMFYLQHHKVFNQFQTHKRTASTKKNAVPAMQLLIQHQPHLTNIEPSLLLAQSLLMKPLKLRSLEKFVKDLKEKLNPIQSA